MYEEEPFGGVTCKRCGASELSWFFTGVANVLLDADNRKHVCNPGSADDFDEIE